MILNKRTTQGFTLIELMVTITIIGILSAMVFASFDQAREQARDKVRKSDLKTLQLAIELYKSQNGTYPTQGCGSAGSDFAGSGAGGSGLASCDLYINGLVPDYIPELPSDPNLEGQAGKGFYYSSNGTSYKLMVLDSVEADEVTSFDNEFARCPTSSCSESLADINKTYAVYSAGAENW